MILSETDFLPAASRLEAVDYAVFTAKMSYGRNR